MGHLVDHLIDQLSALESTSEIAWRQFWRHFGQELRMTTIQRSILSTSQANTFGIKNTDAKDFPCVVQRRYKEEMEKGRNECIYIQYEFNRKRIHEWKINCNKFANKFI